MGVDETAHEQELYEGWARLSRVPFPRVGVVFYGLTAKIRLIVVETKDNNAVHDTTNAHQRQCT